MFNQDFYITFYNGGFILVNTQTKQCFEMDKDSIINLFSKNPEEIQDYIAAGMIKGKEDYSKVIIDDEKWPMQPISRLFHNNVSIKESELSDLSEEEYWEDYLSECSRAGDIAKVVEKVEGKRISLPQAKPVRGDFYDLCKKRKTIREFINKPISLQDFSDVLFTAFGNFHDGFDNEILDSEKNYAWRRSSPAAGSLNSVSPYLFVSNVDGLKKGIYYYDSIKHELVDLDKDFDELVLVKYMSNQPFLKNAAFHVLSVANLNVICGKYPFARSYILPYLDNGHLFQTAFLAVTALNLEYWVSAALCADGFKKLIGFEDFQIPISFFSVGNGHHDSLGPKFTSLLLEKKNK